MWEEKATISAAAYYDLQGRRGDIRAERHS